MMCGQKAVPGAKALLEGLITRTARRSLETCARTLFDLHRHYGKRQIPVRGKGLAEALHGRCMRAKTMRDMHQPKAGPRQRGLVLRIVVGEKMTKQPGKRAGICAA